MTHCRHPWYTNIHQEAWCCYTADFYKHTDWIDKLNIFLVWKTSLSKQERTDFIATYNMGQEL